MVSANQEGYESSYAKGLALEERLVRLFRANGYEVAHNVQMVGRSGVSHQIDLVARIASPLHNSTIVVEAKSYETGIDKDRVMKLIQVTSDLGADRGIIVTTSHFTPAAVKTAEGHNIDLWDRDKLAKLMGEVELAGLATNVVEAAQGGQLVIEPRCSVEEIEESLRQKTAERARGFLGIGKVSETVARCVLTYYPYYDMQLEVSLQEEQRVGIFRKEAVRRTATKVISVDAVLGCIVAASSSGVDYSHLYLAGLTSDELAVMRSSGTRPFDPKRLSALLGMSDGRFRKAVNGLMAKGCLAKESPRPVSYKASKLFPKDPMAVASLSDQFLSRAATVPVHQRYSGTMVEASAVTRAVEAYWPNARVRSVGLLYYPLVVVLLERQDGSTRTEVIDAVTGEPNETLASLPWKAEEVPSSEIDTVESPTSEESGL